MMNEFLLLFEEIGCKDKALLQIAKRYLIF